MDNYIEIRMRLPDRINIETVARRLGLNFSETTRHIFHCLVQYGNFEMPTQRGDNGERIEHAVAASLAKDVNE